MLAVVESSLSWGTLFRLFGDPISLNPTPRPHSIPEWIFPWVSWSLTLSATLRMRSTHPAEAFSNFLKLTSLAYSCLWPTSGPWKPLILSVPPSSRHAGWSQASTSVSICSWASGQPVPSILNFSVESQTPVMSGATIIPPNQAHLFKSLSSCLEPPALNSRSWGHIPHLTCLEGEGLLAQLSRELVLINPSSSNPLLTDFIASKWGRVLRV